MKALDLRIGNYVKLDGFVDTMTVWEIKQDECLLKTFPDYHEYDADYDEISGIVLTIQMLLELGLTERIKDTKFCVDDVKIMACPDTFSLYWIGMFIRDVKFLHELQNLIFALTDRELTLNKPM